MDSSRVDPRRSAEAARQGGVQLESALSEAAREADLAQHRRNELVTKARRSGMTIREIARISGLSRSQICDIVDERDTSPQARSAAE